MVDRVVNMRGRGLRGGRGEASGPLGAGSVGAPEVSNNTTQQEAITSKLRVKSPLPGSVSRTLSAKQSDTVSINDFGGVDDGVVSGSSATGTNNFAAFEAACSTRPVRILLPYKGTGKYVVNGVTALTDLTGVTFDPAPGVEIVVAGAASIPFTFIKGSRSTRLLRTNYLSLRYQDTLASDMRKHVADMGRPGTTFDAQLQIPTKLDFADATHWQLSAFPNGAFVTASPTSATTNTVNWGVPPSNTFVASMFAVVPGDYIAALTTDANSYFPAICIFTDSGYVLVRQDKTGDYSLITKTEKVGSASAVETDTNEFVPANTNYRFVKSMIGIRIFDQRSFGLVLNGTVIRRYRTAGNIQRAGWAGGYGSGNSFVIQSPIMFKGKKSFGIKPLSIIAGGDSTYDETVTGQSAHDFMRQYLAGTGGAQVQKLTNIAKSGQNSQQQKEALGGVTFAGEGYDYLLWPLGINDIQQGVPVATFVQNILECINFCRARNVEPIVGIPAMFYSQTEAQAYNQDGGATTNSANGSSYRLELMRMLADNRVYCNTASFEDMGAVVASLLPMKNSPWGDQVVYDNIHPTTWGAMLLGYGWAKAIIAHMTNAAEQFGDIPLPASYFTGGVGLSQQPRLSFRDGLARLTYFLSTDGVTVADGTTVGTLPKRLHPPSVVIGQIVNHSNGDTVSSATPGLFRIGDDGVMKVWGATGPLLAVSTPTWPIA